LGKLVPEEAATTKAWSPIEERRVAGWLVRMMLPSVGVFRPGTSATHRTSDDKYLGVVMHWNHRSV